MMKFKKYKFLLKPVFFIFSLVFATWLVLKVEKIAPSDFGRYRSLFEDAPDLSRTQFYTKQYIKTLCKDYKAGRLDSTRLEKEINKLLFRKNGLVSKE
ncbi:MAG: hypothetical protein ACXVC6_09655 [Bacteroidia bacterium]